MSELSACGSVDDRQSAWRASWQGTYQNLKGMLPLQLAILTSNIVSNRKSGEKDLRAYTYKDTSAGFFCDCEQPETVQIPLT